MVGIVVGSNLSLNLTQWALMNEWQLMNCQPNYFGYNSFRTFTSESGVETDGFKWVQAPLLRVVSPDGNAFVVRHFLSKCKRNKYV